MRWTAGALVGVVPFERRFLSHDLATSFAGLSILFRGGGVLSSRVLAAPARLGLVVDLLGTMNAKSYRDTRRPSSPYLPPHFGFSTMGDISPGDT